MKSIVILLILSFYSFVSFAQDLDDKQITKINSGQYNFAKGEIQVIFHDTTTAEFVEEQFHVFGIEIIRKEFYPITAQAVTDLPDSVLAVISEHPLVEEISYRMFDFPEEAFQEMIQKQNIPVEKVPEERARFEKLISSKIPRIIFKQRVSEEKALNFVNQHRDYINKLNMITPKSAVVKTEVGKEPEMMKRLKKLRYIQNTAYIALFD